MLFRSLPPNRMLSRGLWRALLLGAACIGLAAVPVVVWAQASQPTTRTDRSPKDLQRDYQRRLNQLAPGDIASHYQLAEWCRDNKAYNLLLRQARYVLSLDGGHANAQLLYRIAVEKLKQQSAQSRPAEGADPAESTDGELLTPAQIQKLRWAEFLYPRSEQPPSGNGRDLRAREPRSRTGRRADRDQPTEFLRVRFGRDVLRDFLDQMSGHRDFDSRSERTDFLEFTPTRQVQLIREHSGEQYQPEIEITNDPLIFREFQQIYPLVMNGCGTLGCHGGPAAQAWRLRTVRPKTDPNLYTNWLILNRVRRGNSLLIDRYQPEDSLLLEYGLPLNEATQHHPDQIPLMFTAGRRDASYRAILAWIETLAVPVPRTGVNLPGYAEPPPPQIGGTRKDKDGAAASAPAK